MDLLGWNESWRDWGEWRPTIDWGDVPTWIASILTSVTVGLALSIIMRDRRRGERAASDSFITWTGYPKALSRQDGSVQYQLALHSLNAGTGPIVAAAVTGTAGNDFHQVLKPDDSYSQVIEPGERLTTTLIYYTKHGEFKDMVLSFRDLNGKTWWRHVQSNKTLTRRGVDKIFNSLPEHKFAGPES